MSPRKLIAIILLSGALAMQAQPAHSSAIPPLPCDFYGDETQPGTLLKIGANVTAKTSSNPADPTYGSCFVGTIGSYGFLSVYPDDLSTPEVEGAAQGDSIYFYINNSIISDTVFGAWQAGEAYSYNVDSATITDDHLAKAYQFLYYQMDKFIDPNDPTQQNIPRLIESYSDPYPGGYLRNEAFVYDDALAMIALLVRGRPEDIRRARLIGQAFVNLMEHDTNGHGPIRDVYNLSDVNNMWATSRGSGAGCGNLAWVINALVQFCKREWNQDFFDTALEIANYIELEYRDDPGDSIPDGDNPGGYINGYAYNSDADSIVFETYKVTEHNIIVHAAFMRLYEIMKERYEATGNTLFANYNDWYESAQYAKSFVVNQMWDASRGMYKSGSGRVIERVLDANSHSIMTFNDPVRNPQILNWVEGNIKMTHDGFTGFAFDDIRLALPNKVSGVWFEGTAYMAMAYQIMGDIPSSNYYLSEVERAQILSPDPAEGAIPAACHSPVETYFHPLYKSPHIAATASYILAKQGYNVLWAIPNGVNSPPMANAGMDGAGVTQAAVTLDGSRSWDPNNDTLTYNWGLSAPAGSAAQLQNANTPAPSFTPDLPGNYVSQLTVYDTDAATDTDSVNISVPDTETPAITITSPAWGETVTDKYQPCALIVTDNAGISKIRIGMIGKGAFVDITLDGTTSFSYTFDPQNLPDPLNPPANVTGVTLFNNNIGSAFPLYNKWNYYYGVQTWDTSGNEIIKWGWFKTFYSTSGGGGHGCFLPGTPVLLPDGSTKAIETFKVGDTILAYDEETKEFKQDQIKHVFVFPEEEGYFVINNRIKVTPHHRFLVKSHNVTQRRRRDGSEAKPRPVPSIAQLPEGTGLGLASEPSLTAAASLPAKQNPGMTEYEIRNTEYGTQWKEAGELKLRDKLLLAKRGQVQASGEVNDGPVPSGMSFELITSIDYVQEPVPVYNLEVNPYHTFIAGGVVVHNARAESAKIGPIMK